MLQLKVELRDKPQSPTIDTKWIVTPIPRAQ